MTTALAKGITLDGGAFALAVEVNDDSSDIAIETVGSAFKAAALGVARGDSTYFLGKLPDASTQRVTFTPSASDTCEWEIELVQLNEDGRKVQPRRGVFTVATTVNMGDVFTADDLVGYPGETFAFLRIYRVEQPPLAGQTLVASATMTVGAINPATARAWPTSAAGSGDLGDGAYDTIAVGGATIPAGYVAAFGGPVAVYSGVGSSSKTLVLGSTQGANENQYGAVACRTYSSETANPIAMIQAVSTSGSSLLYIGVANTGFVSPGNVFIAAGSTTKVAMTANGVTVGTAPPSPTSGRAFAVHTTFHGATPSLRVDDADGHVKLPNDNQILSVGASADLYQVHDGTNSYVVNTVGHLLLRNVVGSGYSYCDFTHAWTFRKDSTEVAAFKPNGVLRLAPQASPPTDVTAGNLYIDTSNVLHIADGAVWVPV